MLFPLLVPTSRSFSAGDWPVKTFRTQAGVETRILYGNKRTGMTMDLSYDNISDANAQLFVDHYNEMLGTYTTFVLGDLAAGIGARTGWQGSYSTLGASDAGNRWRYAEPPTIESIKPGISKVSIKLIGVV